MGDKNGKSKGKIFFSSYSLEEVIEYYNRNKKHKYPHGEPGIVFKDGRFVSFNGKIGRIIYAYCDFDDVKNVPLSKSDKYKLRKKLQLIHPKYK